MVSGGSSGTSLKRPLMLVGVGLPFRPGGVLYEGGLWRVRLRDSERRELCLEMTSAAACQGEAKHTIQPRGATT